MVSIFQIIRQNNVQILNQLIGLATEDVSISNYNNPHLSKEDLLNLQQQLKITGSKTIDLNKRSVNGRTALHVAVTWNRVEIVQLLVDCMLVNVNLQDRENGWTALHRALFMGNIQVSRILLKRQDIDLKIKDWDGFGAFEVYDSTLSDVFPKKLIQKNIRKEKIQDIELNNLENKYDLPIVRTDVYTWGQNTNYVLGHSDSENRSRPERVHFYLDSQQNPAVMKRPAYIIETVSMAKYHMTFLTSESRNNLLICGFGRNGRLGLGKETETQLVPTAISWPERIISVALGRDHTIALTESGVVISFGNNEYGQLGHEIEDSKKKNEGSFQHKPKKIQAQILKKQPIIGVAASRIHSVVYTNSDIFTFGLNQGQLGYYQSNSNEFFQIGPRKVSMSVKIKQVVANDNATVILNNSHEVMLLCNYTQQRLPFPSGIQVDKPASNFVVKLISSGTEYLGAITNLGDVFVWVCTSSAKNNKINKTTVTTPKRIWSSSKQHLSAVDASLGQCGEVILCTVSGHVFHGNPEGNSYKFKEVPYIHRCTHVCANSSGAFAAIRAEYTLNPIKVIPSTFKTDICNSLPYMWIKKNLKKEIDHLESQMLIAKSHISDEDSNKKIQQQEIAQQNFEKSVKTAVNNAWENIETISRKDKTLDIVFFIQGRKVYCHSSILVCRSHIFKNLEKLDKKYGHFDIHLNKQHDDRAVIFIENCELASLLLMVDYIYLDEYEHPMKVLFCSTSLCNTANVKKIQDDLVNLAEVFHLPYLLSSAQSSFNHKPTPSIFSDINELIGNNQPNIQLKTKDKDILCHEFILRQRCQFFNNLLSPQSVWVLHRRKNSTVVEVDLQYMPSDIAETIVRYLYMDEEVYSLFSNIEKGTEEEMLYFLLDVLCEADALLIERLKSIVERALIQFVKFQTASVVLEYADAYCASSLKNFCLEYIKANLSMLLSLRMLDHLPDYLILELEKSVQKSQAEETPLSCKVVYNTDTIDILEVEDEEFSTSIYALKKRDNSNNGSFIETLITLYPDKTHSKHEPQSILKKPKKHINKPSLRDILEETAHRDDKIMTNFPKSTTKKTSQKERRKSSLKSQEPSSSITTKLVWGHTASEPPISLEKVFTEDEKLNLKDKKGKKIYISGEEYFDTPKVGESNTKEKEDTYNPIENICSNFCLVPIHRSADNLGKKNSYHQIQSFKTIQSQQFEDYKLKTTKTKKNILRIQKEEQAIEELKQYYIQTLNIMSGEWFEIQRIVNNTTNKK
uniref:ArbB n=1 Tax=Syzygites megalocarpus TaxID=101119 RepID=G8G8S9_9FUNG|nr:ArbB [Syzygites megalocarpus]